MGLFNKRKCSICNKLEGKYVFKDGVVCWVCMKNSKNYLKSSLSYKNQSISEVKAAIKKHQAAHGLPNISYPDARLATYQLKHISGLEFPQISCVVVLYADKLSIHSSNKEINLAINRIQAIDIGNNDVKQVPVLMNSLIVPVASVTYNATITYHNKSNKKVYIVFEDLAQNYNGVVSLAKKLTPMLRNRRKQTIDL